MKKKIQEIIIRNNAQQIANCLLPKNEEESELIKIFNETLKCINEALEECLKEPSLEECIKEWEEREFKVSNHNKHIVIKLTDKAIDGFIHISKRFCKTYIRCVLSYDLIHLLSKTLKALEEMKDE